ncbi:hypothetical protein GCM10007857_46350 [Bradyrhizobium iriomotense]|uniref:Uncharacterized protein n=1 Tax=Bradyrhizobium iriomotense TaxID=441950 RepID=A0ABQ6B6V3_9BRAD|nr:hypothetical protein GCM10007857_46350 [Bradyrhizobium iriomotense]
MTAASSDPTAFAEIVQIVLASSLFTLWFNSRRSNDPSGFGNGAMCFVISGSNDLSLWHVPQNQAGSPYGSTPRRSNSVFSASKRISVGTIARLVQKMIAAREAIR